MKTIFRYLSLGLVAAVFAVGSGYAQDPCADSTGISSLRDKIEKNYAGNLAAREIALNSGKEFVEKYGSCESVKDFVEWLNGKPAADGQPAVEGIISFTEKWVKEERIRVLRSGLLKRFDDAVNKKNWDEAYAVGAEFSAKLPDDPAFLSFVKVPLGQIGLYQAFGNNFKYNNDTLKYAAAAISDLKAGKKSIKVVNKFPKPDTFGVFEYECNRDDCISNLTYALGYIKYHAQKDKKGGLPHYYEMTKATAGSFKDEPRIYQTIGAYYLGERDLLIPELKRRSDEQVKIKDQADPKWVQLEEQIKSKEGLYKAYSERAIDAFARAHKLAAKINTPEGKKLATGIYDDIGKIYTDRFTRRDGTIDPAVVAQKDKFVEDLIKKPIPDPASAVTPIIDPEPTIPAKDVTSTTPPSTTPAGSTTTMPAPTTPVKPTTAIKPELQGNGTAATPSNNSAAAKKPVAKKPVAKKKKGKR